MNWRGYSPQVVEPGLKFTSESYLESAFGRVQTSNHLVDKQVNDIQFVPVRYRYLHSYNPG